jgi:hypothetical protein
MRRQEFFLGDFEAGGSLEESDFRRGLELVTEPGVLPQAQQYDALEAFVHWGIEGQRPDLALEAYDAYVLHGWTWQSKTIDAQRAEKEKSENRYFDARYKKEEETGKSHDGMPYFSIFEVDYLGAIEGRITARVTEGEAFRNDVLPKIVSGLVASGRVQRAYDFLTSRRAIHSFRGYPRELEVEQCVDAHVETAQALLDPASELVFDGDRDEAFVDLASFSLDYAQFPQFGAFQVVPRLTPIRQGMIEHGLTDPWDIFVSSLDQALREFNKGYGAEFIFNGIRRYMAAAKAGEVADLRTLRDWPAIALEAFDMVEHSSSIPSGLAWLIPAARSGNMRVSASDSFQSSPILGKNILLAVMGDEEAEAEIVRQTEATNQLEAEPLDLTSALKLVTRPR